MRRLQRLMHPPGWFLCTVPPGIFGLLLYLFATDRAEGLLADLVFGLSAYSLMVWCLALPRLRKWLETAAERSALVRRLAASPWGGAFLRSPAFRGKVGLYRGMCSSLLYGVFRGVTGIWYGSVWFLAMAVYYLALGLLRAYLGFCCRKAGAAPSAAYAYACCRNAAWMLLLLDIPMGGMILLMVRTDSGFVYPGYVIYLSAMYTFWIFGLPVKNLLGRRRLGSSILSAAAALNFAAAALSVLGLQTAMISRFSTQGEHFRRLMNSITGGCVYVTVIAAAYMLFRSAKAMKKAKERCPNEPIGEQILQHCDKNR